MNRTKFFRTILLTLLRSSRFKPMRNKLRTWIKVTHPFESTFQRSTFCTSFHRWPTNKTILRIFIFSRKTSSSRWLITTDRSKSTSRTPSSPCLSRSTSGWASSALQGSWRCAVAATTTTQTPVWSTTLLSQWRRLPSCRPAYVRKRRSSTPPSTTFVSATKSFASFPELSFASRRINKNIDLKTWFCSKSNHFFSSANPVSINVCSTLNKNINERWSHSLK